jgi:hypothetical protein
MENVMLRLLALSFLATTGFAQWVFLGIEQKLQTDEGIVFQLDPAYSDYMIVIDMMEPWSGATDVYFQCSTDGGVTWLDDSLGTPTPHVYTGGAFIAETEVDAPQGNPSGQQGIPVTHVVYQGAYFAGLLYLMNTKTGPIMVQGDGSFMTARYGAIFGSLQFTNAFTPINAIRFVTTNIAHPVINRASVSLYGLNQQEAP